MLEMQVLPSPAANARKSVLQEPFYQRLNT